MSGKGKSGCNEGTFFWGIYLGALVVLSWMSFVVFTDMSKSSACVSSVAKWELQTLRWGSLGIGCLSSLILVGSWLMEVLKKRE